MDSLFSISMSFTTVCLSNSLLASCYTAQNHTTLRSCPICQTTQSILKNHSKDLCNHFTHSTTIHDLILNGTINYTIYGECEWVSSNLMMKKASWQTTVSIIIIVVSASRLLLEIIELFQVGFAAPRFE